MGDLVEEGFHHEIVVRVGHGPERRGLDRPGCIIVVDRADPVFRDRVPMLAAADRPLVDIAARTIIGVELQPVGAVVFTH